MKKNCKEKKKMKVDEENNGMKDEESTSRMNAKS